MKNTVFLFLFPLISHAVAYGQEIIPIQNIANLARTNSATAKEQYMGKTIQFTGVVVDTGMSRFLTPYVDLSDRVGGNKMARCVLPYGGITRGRGQLSDFSVGQTVTMSGRVQAVFENDGNNYPNISYGILTKDSKLVE